MGPVSLAVLALFVAVAACLPRAPAPIAAARQITTEGSHLAVTGGTIWYRVVDGGAGTPLILLHGGPGTPSVYLKSMEALADERAVVRYDQLGAGHSDAVKDTALFNIVHFVEELETLRRHLELERVHLYGHSWGETLALEYYRAHPEHVVSLILASDALDVPAFYGNFRRLLAALPDSMYRAVQRQDAGQSYDTASYRAGMKEFSTRYSQHKVILADADSMVRFGNEALSDYMNGSSVFKPTGTLKDYDATPYLKGINIPALFLVGDSDFAGPEIVKRHASMTPGARFVVIPASGHMTMWDNAPANLEAVRSFLREVDGRH